MNPIDIKNETIELQNHMAVIQERIDSWGLNVKNPVVLQLIADDYGKLEALRSRIYELAEMEAE